ncbi:MAG: UvrD-helicase domain-containing protein [bacterium]|nr:UvrD-helicase domain-containing protein [bacterium]
MIRIVSAGAGSGKTFRLTQELVDALDPSMAGTARPEGVVATTFTRKAAAELGERARRAAFARGLPEQADRLAGGMLGTVNSVCGRLLARFAFEAGLSPELRVIEEHDQALLFRQALHEVLEPTLIDDLLRLDRAFGFDRSPPGEERKDWQHRVRAIIDAARSNALDAAAVRASGRRSCESLLALLPRTDAAGDAALDRELRDAVESALAALPAPGDETKATRDYGDELRAVLVSLRRGEALPWSTWARLGKAEPGRKSQASSAPVRLTAARHAEHPRLRDDLTRYVTQVFELAARSLDTYQAWKRERGLVDFVDQEALVLGLLGRAEVRAVLAAELDVTFVDEFQDTSPIQLAVFLELARLARRSVWVGDPKQSIYAFRGADPLLMDAVVGAAGRVDPADILARSYRARPALVAWTSELFAGAFGERWPRERIVLDPVRDEAAGLPVPLQTWVLPAKNTEGESAALAAGIAVLLGLRDEPPVHVVDPATGAVRVARPGDVAILCRTNDSCAEVAAALERAGMRAALARAGLLRTPEAILTLAAMKLLLDAHDTLALAEIVSLTRDDPEPEAWLVDRLAHLAAGRPSEAWAADHPIVQAIAALRAELPWLTPAEALDRVVHVIDAPRVVLCWGRRDQRLGNLDALRRLAGAYEERCTRRGAAATVAGLLAWLDETARQRLDEQSEGLGDDAVVVFTWHGAKGLEWPIVAVADLDQKPRERLWDVGVTSDRETIDLGDPLAGRWIRFWPWPYGGHRVGLSLADAVTASGEKARAESAARDEYLRTLYVALTRARDVLVLPVRPGGAARLRHAGLDPLFAPDGIVRFGLPREPGVHVVAIGDGDVRVPVETRTFAAVATSPRSDDASELWFAPAAVPAAGSRPAARRQASALPPLAVTATVSETLLVGRRLTLNGDPDEEPLGNCLHGFLAADDPSAPDAQRLALAAGLLRRHGIAGAVPESEMLRRATELRTTLGKRYPVRRWLREWPIRLRQGETIVSGFADLVLDTDAGWVVVDHKSFKGGREQWAAKAAEHTGQLAAYAGAMRAASGRAVVGVWLHFVVGGGLVRVEVGGGEDVPRHSPEPIRHSQLAKQG